LRGCLGIENAPSTWKDNSLVNKITSITRKPTNGRFSLSATTLVTTKVRAAILEQQGYVVDTVRDAEEARTHWQTNFYNLVLVDERNPWAGIKFCQEIGKVASPRQQVALLVGYHAPATTVSAFTLIPKGEDAKYFVDRIRRLFRDVAEI
jgi:DNA-binding NtrC family response regulator